jgi:D-ribitol-5-phosphate cytidylyltransferase
MKVTCILLAGGKGLRAESDIPKQFVMAHEKPVFLYSALTLNHHSKVDHIIMVCSPEWRSFSQEWIDNFSLHKITYFALPGKSRQHSILNGLEVASSFMNDGDLIIIHDAARPIINPNVLTELIDTAQHKGYALPVIPINDAVYVGNKETLVDGIVEATFRYHGQTPVCLDFMSYYRMNLSASDEELTQAKGTCTLLFNNGHTVQTVAGDPLACKITSLQDLICFLEMDDAATNSEDV